MKRGQQFFQAALPGMERKTHLPISPISRVPAGHTISIAAPLNSLSSIFKDNKFKNMFETDAGVGGRSEDYRNMRTHVENSLFGTPHDAPGSVRPIYGYLRSPSDDRHVMTNSGDTAQGYGGATIDIKNPTRGTRVTTTAGDSFASWGAKNAPSLEGQEGGAGQGGSDSHYREVQLHDRPVPLSDVSAVHMGGRMFRNTGTYDLMPHEAPSDAENKAHAEQMRAHRVTTNQARSDIRKAGYTGPIHQWENHTSFQPSLFQDDTSQPDSTRRGQFSSSWVDANPENFGQTLPAPPDRGKPAPVG